MDVNASDLTYLIKFIPGKLEIEQCDNNQFQKNFNVFLIISFAGIRKFRMIAAEEISVMFQINYVHKKNSKLGVDYKNHASTLGKVKMLESCEKQLEAGMISKQQS